jgi:hypothetical protein
LTQDQQNIRTTFDTVLKFLNKNNSIWSGKVAFANAVTRATAAVAAVDQASDAQQKPTTGVTQDKGTVRDELKEETLRIADQLSALATKTDNMDLAAQVEMTKSSLDKLLDNDLEQAAERVANLATTNIAALADYDITAADVTAFNTLRDDFNEMKTAPRQAATDRSVATATLPVAMRTARSIFRNEIDKQMLNFKKTNPDFYNGYFAARVIVNKAATLKSASGPAGPTPTPVPGGTPAPTP